ncbi:MAG: sigma-54-dependent Fis family transcriptional regulator [Nitrospirae bacterium]|nr:sigma-54-dependent Fis family transcriptional regulator [Candidatus Manganitrophaceae bacterium]
MRKGQILVIDDEKSQRDILKVILKSEGYGVQTAGSTTEALKLFEDESFDLVLSDLKMPDNDGLFILDRLFKINAGACVIIMTAHGTIDSAVEAIKKGAFDYLTKPLDREELLISVARAFEKMNLVTQNKLLKEQLSERFGLSNIIGNHIKMQDIFKTILKIANSTATVLVLGESGTGKELIARAIHYNSLRKDRPFLAINCAAIPDTLIESELFGYEKGAFTGATGRGIGLFEAADGGTLFLDEVGDLSLTMQAKILRTIQQREVRRVGGREEIKIDVRVIAATNKNLKMEIQEGNFREDLFYRLNVISIRLPSLAERATDIPALTHHFLEKYNQRSDKKIRGIARPALRLLLDYSWPGNVRELESTIERAVLLCEGETLEPEDLPQEVRLKTFANDRIPFDIPPQGFSLEDFEKELLIKAMEKSGGVIAKAAKLLGISYRTLQYRLEKFNLRKEEESVPKGIPPAPKGK